MSLVRALSWIAALILPGTIAQAGPAIDSLFQLVQDKNATSVENVVPFLPPSLLTLQSITLMYFSRSLQFGSYAQPRVILSSPRADFILAFSGNSLERGFGTIEAIEFDSNTKLFHFAEIDFNPSSPLMTRDPQKCVACHGRGANAHPIFDSYPLWPGAYGGGEESDSLSTEEGQGWARFQSRLHQAPYNSVKALSQVDLDQLNKNNTSFNEALASRNYERIAKTLTDSPQFSAYHSALDAAMNRPTDFLHALSCADQKAYAETYSQLFFGTSSSIDSYTQDRDQRFTQLTGQTSFISLKEDSGAVAPIRFLAERMGVSTEDWAMTLAQGSYSFINGEYGIRFELEDALTQIAGVSSPAPTVECNPALN